MGSRLIASRFLRFLHTFGNISRAKVQDAGQLAFHHMIGADPLWRGAPCPIKQVLPPEAECRTVEEGDQMVTLINTPVGSLRFAHVKSDSAGETAFLIEHPLKSEEDYKVQMWIEEHTVYLPDPEAVQAHLQGDGREGLSLGMLMPRGKSAYQFMVEHLAGTEELIYAQMDFPDTVRSLWEIMVAKDLEVVKMALESDYDYFLTFEDSSTQNYSPVQYDDFIGSEIGQWTQLLDHAGKRYVQHACGHIDALIEKMPAHGTFAVESLSPPPTGNLSVKDARAKVGERLGIIGGIEPTEFLNREGDELDRYVESVIEDAQGGPFVLANSDSCPPGVTVEKFKQVADIARLEERV